MADISHREGNPLDCNRIQGDLNPRDKEESKSTVSELVQSIFADPEALQLLQSAFTIPSEEAINVSIESRPHNEPEVQITDAVATKACDSARTRFCNDWC